MSNNKPDEAAIVRKVTWRRLFRSYSCFTLFRILIELTLGTPP